MYGQLQIIMAKLTGGPKVKPQGNWDGDGWQDEPHI